MHILGIETSCDETAAAVVRNGRTILSNVVATSLKEHQKFGGIIPEIASRHQMELIQPVVKAALKKAGITLKQVGAIAVTRQPGLIGSLLVGLSFARALSYAGGKPLVHVDHIKAHLYANALTRKTSRTKTKQKEEDIWPAVGLIVSGGHTSLYHMKHPGDYALLGQTRDDAAGEAFDKVARILGLGYPGGPAIDRLAVKGDSRAVRFPRTVLKNDLDFSFSGLKTAVLYHHRKHQGDADYSLADVAASFQESAVSVLTQKALAACRQKNAKRLLIGGGVAANSALRKQLMETASQQDIRVFFPPLELCMDNAAMIAGLGYHLI